MCIVYLFAGLSKLQGVPWWNGTAMWLAFGNLEYQSADMTWLAWHPYLVDFLTHFTALWEISFCVLVWIPLCRPLVLASSVVMHLGIGACLGLWTFSLIMLVGCASFLPPDGIGRSVAALTFGRAPRLHKSGAVLNQLLGCRRANRRLIRSLAKRNTPRSFLLPLGNLRHVRGLSPESGDQRDGYVLHVRSAHAEQERTINLIRDPTLTERQFPWGVIPAHVDETKVLKLCVNHDDMSIVTLPEFIGRLPNLLWLDIPRRFVPNLVAGALPPTLFTLRIAGGGKVAVPKDLTLAGLEWLWSDRDGMLRFSPEQIPDVRRLNLKLDFGGSLLREIARMPQLIYLEASPISNRGVLETITKLPLQYLKATRGNLDSIEPLRDCPSLTNLWLENLTRLTSLSPLAELPDLSELMVTYCSRLKLDRSMLQMPAIRKLYFFANKNIGMTAIRPELEGMGLEFFLCSGTS